MSPRGKAATVIDHEPDTASGPVPAGEPRPGPLPSPEQPQPRTPAPGPDSDPPPAEPTDRERALDEVRRQITAGEVGIGALLRDLTPAQVRDEALDVLAEAGLAAEPDRDEHPLSVHEAIAEVTRRVRHIAKDKQTTGGERFNFRGIDDVLDTLHPILGEVGLVLMPGHIVERERETRPTRQGGTLNVCHVTVRYTLIGPDGTREVGEACGEAGDSGDKATQKAMSQAYKSFTLQTFSIPTQQSALDEPDATHELSAPWSGDQLDRAERAWQAARDATTYDRLFAVRQQAQGEGLLAVPAGPMPGTALGVLLDQRRAQLDEAGGHS